MTFIWPNVYLFQSFFPQYHCGFHKGYNAQHCLLVMTEEMKDVWDNSKVCAAVLTDLSKGFDCLLHDLKSVSVSSTLTTFPMLAPIEVLPFPVRRRHRKKNWWNSSLSLGLHPITKETLISFAWKWNAWICDVYLI